MIEVKFKKLSDTAIPFSYSREGDACMDIYSDKDIYLHKGFTTIVPSNIAVEIPVGYEGIVRGRSGLYSKGLCVQLGTIDENYRGSIGVIISNISYGGYHIKAGDRIAQFTIKPVTDIILTEVEELSSTERGSNGYGSSGK